MTSFLIILVSVVLVDNFVLSQFLGICSFLGCSNKVKTATGMSLAVIFVLVMATAATWPIKKFLLDPNGLDYLTTLVFILVIAGLVQFVETALKKYVPSLYRALGIFLPLITTNCAVLAVTFLNFDNSYTYMESLVNSIGAGLGYFLAIMIFTSVRMRMEDAAIPKSLRGLPILLIAAAIVSVAFLGFKGLTEGLFG